MTDTPPDQLDRLDRLRRRIARIDAGLINRLAERRKLSLQAARCKDGAGQALRDQAVERRLLTDIIGQARRKGLDVQYAVRLFHLIIEDSLHIQQGSLQADQQNKGAGPRVAYLGGAGSYSQQAGERFFARRGVDMIDCGAESFEDVIQWTEAGRADYAVLPVENSTSGGINEVYDLLQHTTLSIVGELTHRIEHCLLAGAGVSGPDDIHTLYVHPQVHAQCSHYLGRLDRVAVAYCTSTSDAMKTAADKADSGAAAIGSAEGGALYGLHVLQGDLANHKQNHTRFIVAARQPAEVPEGLSAKTTLILSVDQKPGALVDALTVFRDHGVNMLKLESRPMNDNPWEEIFYIDCEGHLRDAPMAAAVDELARRTRFLKVLGCYAAEEVAPTAVPAEDIAGASDPAGAADQPANAPAAAPKPPARPAAADKNWRLASRSHRAEGTVIHCGMAHIGDGGFSVIAGPCSVESDEQVRMTARAVRDRGGVLLRGGCFKPRTNPYSFQGLGLEGLELLRAAGDRYGLPIITEVLAPDQVRDVAARAQVLQIGARNMQNFPLLRAIGRTQRPVMLKRGMMASIDELLQAAEYILAEGNKQVMLCERGIRTFESATRNTLDLSAVPVLKQLSHLPVIVDPSHAVGRRDLVIPMARAAKAVGADGIIVEVHPDPEKALSDGPQALTFDLFAELMDTLYKGDAPVRKSA